MNKKITSSLLALSIAFSGFPIANYTPVTVVQADDDVATVALADDVYDEPGSLDTTTTKYALNTLNYIRYIAGIGYNVQLKDEYNVLAQNASYLNNYNGYMSHYPAYTYGYSGSGTGTASEAATALSSRSFYATGVSGAKASNLGYASGGTTATNDPDYSTYPAARKFYDTIVHGWMEDADSSNIVTVGHRRWCLDPDMSYTGFGAVISYDKNDSVENEITLTTTTHNAMYAQDDTSGGGTQGVIWPAQNTPTDVFGSSYPWSYSYGKNFSGAVTVTVTNLSTGNQVGSFDSNSSGEYNSGSYISLQNESSYAGQLGCVIFQPSNISVTAGSSYWVEIKDGGSTIASYPVSFFDIDSSASSGLVAPSATDSSFTDTKGNSHTITGVKVTAPTQEQISSAYRYFEIATAKTTGVGFSTNPDTDKTGSSTPNATKYDVTHTLTKLTSSNNATSIADGETYTTTLAVGSSYTSEYQLPAEISVKMGGASLTEGTGYTYTNGVITINNVTGKIEITAQADEIPEGNTVTVSSTGLSINHDSTTTHPVEDGANYKGTLTAGRDYTLPASITVKMDGTTVATTDFTYDGTSGEFTIDNVTGAVVITAVGDYKLPDLPTPVISSTSPNGTNVAEVKYELSFSSTDDGGDEVDDTLYSIQWYADGVPISGENSATFYPGNEHLGAEITVGITSNETETTGYTYNSTEQLSAATTAVVAYYDITFKDEDGDVITSIGTNGVVVTEGNATLGSSFPATLDSYTIGDYNYIFKGFYDTDDNLVDENTQFTEDTTVTAKYVKTVGVGDIEIDEAEVTDDNGDTIVKATITVTASSNNVKINLSELVGSVAIADIEIDADNLDNFIVTDAETTIDADIVIELPVASNSSDTDDTIAWTISAGTELKANVNLAVTVDEDTVAGVSSNSGTITFAHSGDLITDAATGGTGLTLAFPVPNGKTITTSSRITLTKEGSTTAETVTGSYVDANTIKATFTNCSTWGVNITSASSGSGGYGSSTSTSTSTGSSSSGSSSSGSSSAGAGYSYSGSVSVNGTFINELRGVLVGEMVNLSRITTVNGQEVIGWYYDAEFTQAVSNPETFVFSSDVIASGLYAKTTGTVSGTLADGSTNAGAGGVTSGAVTGSTGSTSGATSDTNSSYVPSAVPSTFAKILAKLF